MPLNQREKERKGWGGGKNILEENKTKQKTSTFKEQRKTITEKGKNLAV